MYKYYCLFEKGLIACRCNLFASYCNTQTQSTRIGPHESDAPSAHTRKAIPIKPVFDPEAKVYPRTIKGVFTRWRWIFVWLTQIVFYGLCWLPWHGRQAILLDIDQRKFYFFDLVLWPQDTIYLVLLMVLGALALFLFTAVAGRLWMRRRAS